MKKEEPTFWVTNQCNRNVSLADLNVTIPAFRSVNLLDKKHYSYTLEQLEKSEASGSIFVKRAMIKKRKVAPTVIKADIPFIKETYIPTRERSILSIKEEFYEELQISDDDYAKENADSAEADTIKPFFAPTNKG